MPKTRWMLTRMARSPSGLRLALFAVFLLFAINSKAQEQLDCLIEPNLLVDVSSSEVGVLGSVGVDEADVVQQGDVIAALRTGVEQAVLKLSRARADAVAEIALLRRDYEFNTRQRDRIDKLSNQRVVSAQSVDEARTTEDLARLRLRAASEKQHTVQLEAVRDALSLERRTVRSPITGVVVQRYKSSGEFVEGDPIVQLAQLDPLRVEVVAPISMFGSIRVGMQATVLAELPMDGDFVATVKSIDPIMDAATATFGVRLSLPNPENRLPPGLKCTLVMNAKKVPPEATEEAAVRAESASVARTPSATLAVPVDHTPDNQAPDNQAISAPGTEPDVARAPSAALTASVQQTPSTPGSEPAAAPAPMPAMQTAKQAAAANPEPVSTAPPAPTLTAPIALQAPAAADNARVAALRMHACATLGPIAPGPEAEAVATRLTASDIGFERRYVGGSKVRTPWIVLSRDVHPAPANITERLQRAGISDFQLLRKGEWQNRVSYGGYSGKKSAQRRLQAMKTLGFDAELQRRTRGNTKIWLDLAHAPGDPALSSLSSSLLNEHPTLTLRSIPCTQLASR